MTEHVVAGADELEDGQRVTSQVDGREVTVFRIDGRYYAYLNWCMHQSGPVCEGDLGHTTTASFDRASLELETRIERDGEILYCPWHGFQYDITSGQCLSRESLSLPSYPVTVAEGEITVEL